MKKQMAHSPSCRLLFPRTRFTARPVGLRWAATRELCVSRRDATYLVGIPKLAGASRPSFPGRSRGKVLRQETVPEHRARRGSPDPAANKATFLLNRPNCP